MEVPGHGLIKGFWDLRPNVGKYLGGVDFRGKRVLEVGTASGYLCLHMERQGADVVAFDLSDDENADVVPFARYDTNQRLADHKAFMKKIKNAYWLAHRAHQSKARVVYGTTYAIPEAIGPVDISVFGAILLHLRDPFFALQNALRLTRETVIITESLWHWHWPRLLRNLVWRWQLADYLMFIPHAPSGQPPTTWWLLSPGAVKRFIAVLGFEDAKVTYHFQRQEGVGRILCFTVVGRRTAPLKL
jgi:SAM-dependent methyltransferase